MEPNFPSTDRVTHKLKEHPQGGDRWLLWPTIVALTVTFVVLLISSLPGPLGFLLLTLLVFAFVLLGWPFLAIILLAIPVILVRYGRFRGAISVAAAILLTTCLFKPIAKATVYVHLPLTILFDMGQLGSTIREDRLTVHDWSIGLVGSGNTFLIEDSSDQIALPRGTSENTQESKNVFWRECKGRVTRVFTHYYLCYF